MSEVKEAPTRVSIALAAVAVVVIPLRVFLPHQIPVSDLIALALIPIWLPVLRRYRFAPWFFGTGLLALAAGFWLSIDHAPEAGIVREEALGQSILLVTVLLSVAVILWARTVLGTWRVSLVFGIGLALGILPLNAQFAENPWKFSFAFPVAVLTLVLAQRSRVLGLEILALLALGVISATHDFRSMFGQLLLALAVVVVQVPLRRTGRTGSTLRILIGLGLLAVIVYNVGQGLILGGALGAETQARSIAQLDASGSLLVGGRPEIAATLALMAHSPFGFGIGTPLTADQLMVAKEGMAAVGYDPNNGYVEVFLFGGHVELHSVIGDLWAHYGVAGIAFALVIAGSLVVGLSRRVALRRATPVVVFVVAQSLWFLFFGPFLSSASSLSLALGLVALPAMASARAVRSRPLLSRTDSPWPTVTSEDPSKLEGSGDGTKAVPSRSPSWR